MSELKMAGEVLVKRGREQSILRKHPWLFSGAIHSSTEGLRDGDWVEVKEGSGKILGRGHYQKGSITVRLITFGKEEATAIYHRRISEALRLRQVPGIIPPDTNCFRLIHGEGDGLPGLVVDVYDRTAIIQSHSAGMSRDKAFIARALTTLDGLKIEAVYFRDTLTEGGEYLAGKQSEQKIVSENGCLFTVDWEQGQKTGFFLDQRDNRALLGQYSKGKKVLNTFCYTGGFTVYALKANASLVHSVDASASAIELCEQNIRLNGFDPAVHKCFAEDVFKFLQGGEEKYDVIVLDPPAFAKHREAKHQAMKGYQRLNLEAMRIIGSDGIIFTFSCSQVVDRQLFYDTVMSAAMLSGRAVRVLGHLSQPADHPVSAFHPEGAYLKGLILQVS